MARSHHRKKHKEHLRTYQHSIERPRMKQRKAKVTGIFSVIGLVLGLAISFFSSAPAILIAAGAIVGGFIGYFIGMKVDAQTEK